MLGRHRCCFNRWNNMQRVCHLFHSRCCCCSTGQHRCGENVLLRNVLLFSESDAVIFRSPPHDGAHICQFLCRFCRFFPAANWSNRLNRLNLSPIIKSDYRNLREAPSRLAGDYTAGGSLTYLLVLLNFQLSGLRKFSRTAIKGKSQDSFTTTRPNSCINNTIAKSIKPLFPLEDGFYWKHQSQTAFAVRSSVSNPADGFLKKEF